MKMYYVRHGQTDWNLARKMQGGESERELNETGIEQARETKEKLKDKTYDLVICSPMQRANQTADIINKEKNIPKVIDERLRERKLGELEGNDITKETEELIWNYDLNYEIRGGESIKDFEKRILNFLEDIKEKYKDKTLLIVAHGGVAKIIKAYLNGMPEGKHLDEIEMKNCEIIEAEL